MRPRPERIAWSWAYYMGRDGGGGMGQREGFQLRNFRREEGAAQLPVSHFGIRIRAG